MALKRYGFSLAEIILVSVFSAVLLMLTYLVFSSMSKTSRKAEANDASVFNSASLISEHMSSSMRFTSSSLIKIFNYYIYPNDSRVADTAIVGFPVRGDRRPSGASGFASAGDLGYYIQNPGVDKSMIDEWIDPSGSMEWTSYIIYYYHYDPDKAKELEERKEDIKVLNVGKLPQGAFVHKSLYEIKFFIKNSNDGNFKDSVSGSEYVFFMQPKTSSETGAGLSEMGLSDSACPADYVIAKDEDFSNFLRLVEKACKIKNDKSVISVKKLASNVERFNVSRIDYPLISVRADLNYGKGGSSSNHGMKGDLVEKEIHTLSFSILPAVR